MVAFSFIFKLKSLIYKCWFYFFFLRTRLLEWKDFKDPKGIKVQVGEIDIFF